jgi:hypothetical protein
MEALSNMARVALRGLEGKQETRTDRDKLLEDGFVHGTGILHCSGILWCWMSIPKGGQSKGEKAIWGIGKEGRSVKGKS